MRHNSLALINIRDEYMQALLSPLYEELGLDEPMEERLAIDLYTTRELEQIGITNNQPNWEDFDND